MLKGVHDPLTPEPRTPHNAQPPTPPVGGVAAPQNVTGHAVLKTPSASRGLPELLVSAARPEGDLGAWAGRDTVRIFAFLDASRLVVLTHGFMKKSQRVPRSEIELAEKRKADYLRRQK